MRLTALFTIALFALTALCLVLVLLTAIRKALRAARQRRRARLEAAVRPALMAYLAAEHDDPAALAITGRGVERTLCALASSLLPKLRGGDSEALVWLLHSRGVLEQAVRRLRRRGPVGRARAAELLGAARAYGADEELTRLLDDPQPEVRMVAARALGKLGDPAAVAPLLASLGARRSIPVSVVTMSLLHIGPSAAAPLCAVLEDRAAPPPARRVAAELLGLLGATEAMGALIAILEDDPDLQLRTAAADSLGRIGAPRAARPLIANLSEGPPGLRAAAARALGEIGAEAALAPLRSALASERIVARAAAHALAASQAGQQILKAVAGGNGPGASEAREALGELARQTARRGPTLARVPA